MVTKEQASWKMLQFLTRHQITLYELATLLEVDKETLRRWRDKGPAQPKLFVMALKQAEREMKDNG